MSVAPMGRICPSQSGPAAGIGVALKPHFLLIALGMEGALFLRRGWKAWRPSLESVLLVLVAGICAAATVASFPEYYERIVPLARAVYGGFEAPLQQIVVWGQLGCIAVAVLAPLAGKLTSVMRTIAIRRNFISSLLRLSRILAQDTVK